jgi:hypothetical protein
LTSLRTVTEPRSFLKETRMPIIIGWLLGAPIIVLVIIALLL